VAVSGTTPLTEEGLREIEQVLDHVRRASIIGPRPLIGLICDNVPRLVADVRRLFEIRKDRDRCEAQFFSATVEIDNLRKMLADANSREDMLRIHLSTFHSRHPELFDEAHNRDAERLTKLEAVAAAAKVFSAEAYQTAPIGRNSALYAAGEELKRVVAELDPKPVPMCKTDGEGRPA
jgi:hypothetical protein